MIKELPFSEQSALFARFSNLAYQAPKEATKLFKKAGFDQVTYYVICQHRSVSQRNVDEYDGCNVGQTRP